MMPEKKKYVSPGAIVFWVEKDVLTLSGLSTSTQEFGVMGDYVLDSWGE